MVISFPAQSQITSALSGPKHSVIACAARLPVAPASSLPFVKYVKQNKKTIAFFRQSDMITITHLS